MSTAYLSRVLQMLLQPLQGSCAAGTALIRADVEGTVMPDQLVLEPIVGGAEAEESIVKVERNPDTEDGSWVVGTAGTVVPVTSVQGGAHVNLGAGTPLRFDTPPPGILEAASVASELTGGTRLESFGTIHQVRAYKDLGSRVDAQSLFAAQLGDFPAAVLCWEATTPGDGSLTPSLGFDPTRVGRGRRIYTHKWTLFIVCSRLDSSDRRKREGDAIRDGILPILTDRKRWRDVVVSCSVRGISIDDVRAVAATETAYVDAIRFSNSFPLARIEERNFSPWKKTHLQIEHPTDPPGQTLIDDTEDMPGT